MFNKSDLLAKLTKNTQRPNEKLDKNVVLDQMKNHFTPKTGGKSVFLNKLRDNQDLAKPTKTITFESFNKPRLDIKSITKRFIMEAETASTTTNPIRLDMKSIALNNIHSKFTIVRGNDNVVVELLYPNAESKITVKVILPSGDDRLLIIDPQDPNYISNFSAMVLKEVDKAITNSKNKPIDYKVANSDTSVGGGQVTPVLPSLGGYAPVWESKWVDAFALVEADDEEADAAADAQQEIDTEPPAVNTEGDDSFGAEDFSADGGDAGFDGGNGGDMFGGDFGGSGSLSSLGGGMDMGGDSGGVNSDGSAMGGEVEGEFVQFRTKDDWTQGALDTMQKLTADATAEQMQNGTGVVLSSSDVLKGTVGIENDSNFQIIDKFLKIYPELDEVDIPEDMMNEIEDKLSKNDGQFDAFLQQNLSKITGSDDVNSTLDNEMFADFKPMGGELNNKTPPTDVVDVNDGAGSGAGSDLDSFFDLDAPTTPDTDGDGFDIGDGSGESDLHAEAAKSVGSVKEDEFPNLS